MYRTAFIWLGGLGGVLLQGLLTVDGGLVAILKTIYNGQFPWGKRMALIYTGLPVVDQFANIQVAFWDPVVTVAGIPRLQACMLCASLQVAGVWLAIDGLREDKHRRHWIIKYAPLYVFLWQGVGTAIFLPFFFLVELQQHRDNKSALKPQIELSKAMAILPAAIFSLAQPFAMVFYPGTGLTESQHQTALAIYQFGPLMGYALVSTFSQLLPTASEKQPKKSNADEPWVKLTYAVCGVLSAAVHVSCLFTVLASTSGQDSMLSTASGERSLGLPLSLENLFIPSFGKVWAADKDTLLTQASLFFLQWDFIICALAGALYCTAICRSTLVKGVDNTVGGAGLVSLFSLASFLVGPGLVVSTVLYFRESVIRQEYDGSQSSLYGTDEKEVIIEQ